jgi:5-methylcytosine-specific restriction endonuclease McrA
MPRNPVLSATPSQQQKKKATIPKALREQVWLKHIGRNYEQKCLVDWCQNTMTVFDFHVGHNIPESLGGETNISNLKPICSRCNLSMGSQYTITEWTKIGNATPNKNPMKIKVAKVSPATKVAPEPAETKKPWWLLCC